jgi:GDPmannose 4,6-dehydratase
LGAANIKKGLQKELYLGNLESKRDFGYAKDYVEAMWLMLQQDKPDDYIIASGETHSVKEILNVAFETMNLDWHKYVEYDQSCVRPSEVDLLCGDYTKARDVLKWRPKISFRELIMMMVKNDYETSRPNSDNVHP